MKSKTNNRKLRKYNKGYNPGGMPTPFGIQTNYAIPKPSPSAGMKSAMAAGTNDVMSRAGDRIASQAPDIAGQVGNIAGSVLGAVGAGVEAWKDPELAQQKTSMTRGPLVYEKTALVNSEKEFKDLSSQNTGNTLKSVGTGASAGAAIGSVIPGAGCVCADTIVYTKNGGVKKIQDLVEEDGIIGYSGGQIDPQDIKGFTEPNIKPCVEITTVKGEKLRCSEDHPIVWSNSDYYSETRKYADDGTVSRFRKKEWTWREAHAIKPNEQIAIIERIPIFGTDKLDNARMIGMMIGDGSYDTNHGVRYYSMDIELQQFAELNGGELKSIRNYNKPFNCYIFRGWSDRLRSIGIFNQSGINKTLPTMWWRYDRNSLAELIGGLYDTDGCVNLDGDRVNIKISQISKTVIDNLKLMLLRFGVHCNYSIEKAKSMNITGKVYQSKESHVLTIRDKNSLINFYNSFYFLIKHKQDKLSLVPELYANRKGYHNDYGVIFDTVKSVVHIGDQEIYNLEALGSHTYLANNIVTHNTVIGGAIGAVGGLVSGLLGGGKRKRKMKRLIAEQNEKTGNKNTFNQSGAHTDQLQQEYASQNENTQDDQLYNKGKTPFVGGKDSNSLVGKGETIVDGDTGDLTEVQHGSAVGTDDVPALINPQDAIAGNLKSKVTGNTFAEDMKPLTRMESRLKRNTDRNIRSIAANTEKLVKAYTQPLAASILQQQALQHRDESKSKYNWGKVGEYAMNGISDIASLAPTMYNFYQGLQNPDQVSASELYSPNANAQAALTKMGKRRYNQAPELEALRGLESRQRYNARQLGSEGGLNRAMDVAGALGTRRSISDVYAKKQNVDNQYLGEEASMAAQLGAQEAQARTMAMREAYDINAKNKAMQKQYQAASMQGLSEFAQMGKKNRNLRKMDSAKLRMAERYMGLGTTASNIDYIFGNLR